MRNMYLKMFLIFAEHNNLLFQFVTVFIIFKNCKVNVKSMCYFCARNLDQEEPQNNHPYPPLER